MKKRKILEKWKGRTQNSRKNIKTQGGNNEKSSQNLKVREALEFFSLLKFSIFSSFSQYQYQYQYQNSHKVQYQYQNQYFGNANFNINIKINILKL